MADNLSYQPTPRYIPAPYFTAPDHGPSDVRVVGAQPDQDINQRKRPKYTRSKTGCLTCRVKKIKCDETKPSCMRCTHGQRECTWPEGIPPRKKAPSKDSFDGRPSTSESSGLSESSSLTPPTRDPSPPRRTTAPVELGLPPLISRRPSDQYTQLQHEHSLAFDSEPGHRHRTGCGNPGNNIMPSIHNSTSHGNMMSTVPQISTYPVQARYHSGYPNSVHSIPTSHVPVNSVPLNARPLSHNHTVPQWGPPIISNADPIEYYHSPNNGHYARYQ